MTLSWLRDAPTFGDGMLSLIFAMQPLAGAFSGPATT